eukprot:671245-Prorocentrum_minimum.AAC.1
MDGPWHFDNGGTGDAADWHQCPHRLTSRGCLRLGAEPIQAAALPTDIAVASVTTSAYNIITDTLNVHTQLRWWSG